MRVYAKACLSKSRRHIRKSGPVVDLPAWLPEKKQRKKRRRRRKSLQKRPARGVRLRKNRRARCPGRRRPARPRHDHAHLPDLGLLLNSRSPIPILRVSLRPRPSIRKASLSWSTKGTRSKRALSKELRKPTMPMSAKFAPANSLKTTCPRNIWIRTSWGRCASLRGVLVRLCTPSRLDGTGIPPSSRHSQLGEQPLRQEQIRSNHHDKPNPVRHLVPSPD